MVATGQWVIKPNQLSTDGSRVGLCLRGGLWLWLWLWLCRRHNDGGGWMFWLSE